MAHVPRSPYSLLNFGSIHEFVPGFQKSCPIRPQNRRSLFRAHPADGVYTWPGGHVVTRDRPHDDPQLFASRIELVRAVSVSARVQLTRDDAQRVYGH